MTDNTFEVYKLLEKSGGKPLSGESAARALGISRAGVGKHVQKLRDAGFEIESATRSGHTLRPKEGIYNEYTVKSALEKLNAGNIGITFLQSAKSTNDVAASKAYSGEGAVIARFQTAGRGRKQRPFDSGAGGIYMSYYRTPKALKPYDALMSVLAAGVAVAVSLRELGAEAGLKWPNDVFVFDRKVSGILCEMQTSSDIASKLILGIGINTHNLVSPLVAAAAGSLSELGYRADNSALAASVLARVSGLVDMIENGQSAEVLELYRPLSVTFGSAVRVLEDLGGYEGVAEDVDSNGFLLVRQEGVLKRVINADVSIR